MRGSKKSQYFLSVLRYVLGNFCFTINHRFGLASLLCLLCHRHNFHHCNTSCLKSNMLTKVSQKQRKNLRTACNNGCFHKTYVRCHMCIVILFLKRLNVLTCNRSCIFYSRVSRLWGLRRRQDRLDVLHAHSLVHSSVRFVQVMYSWIRLSQL